jgi:predicted dehydrogenase
MTSPVTRRSFLAVAAAAPIVGSVAAGFPANETINVGVIGSGGRARQLMQALRKIENVRLAAVCDVWDVALEEGRKLADPQAMVTKRYQDLLDSKEIHAVLIGTPDHWHVPLTVAACDAGKDVYVEKPLTHKLAEGQAVIDAQNRTQRIVQVGTQQRSMPHIAKARELVKAGKIGQVFKVTMSWNRNTDRVRRFPLGVKPEQVDWKAFLGNAPEQPFDEYRFRNWRWFWDFGGGLFTDLMVHWVDVAHWVLDLDCPEKHPLKAVSLGEFVAAKDVWETPDTVQTLLSYPGGIQMHYEGTFSNARRGAHIEFMGTLASLYIDRGRFEVIPERNKKTEAMQEIVATNPDYRGADFYDRPDGELLHVQNWIDCIRSRKPPTAPAEAGVTGAAAAHLANVALRSGQTAVWKDA